MRIVIDDDSDFVQDFQIGDFVTTTYPGWKDRGIIPNIPYKVTDKVLSSGSITLYRLEGSPIKWWTLWSFTLYKSSRLRTYSLSLLQKFAKAVTH